MGEVIRKCKNGRFIGWYLRWCEGGRRRVLRSKQRTMVEARRMLVEIEARVARGEVGVPERRSLLTVGELVERFLVEYSRPTIKDIERLRRAEILFPQRATQVAPGDVRRLVETLRRSYAPATAKVTLDFLGTVFAWALREDLITKNPCAGIERPQVAGSLDFLSRAEILRLLQAASDQAIGPRQRMLHLAVSLAVYVGLRKGELLGLRWMDIDVDTRRLTVARSYGTIPKGKKTRYLRLPTSLIPAVTAWRLDCPPSPDGLVFPTGRGGRVPSERASLGLRRLWRAIGLREVLHPWHILRHTFASHFMMSGGNILTLQRILGHADLKMTLRYAHLAPDFLQGELDRLSYC